jgi:hypothetical protein
VHQLLAQEPGEELDAVQVQVQAAGGAAGAEEGAVVVSRHYVQFV